jgi:pseudaminic acid biosynthesis-associated methylase
MTEDPQLSEARRLEDLWSGEFGDDYVDRNAAAYERRGPFWESTIGDLAPRRVLEVGANIGGNLEWIARKLEPSAVYGVDVNRKALQLLSQRVPGVNAVWSPGRDLPFRDRWFDLVFTMGVLIHQPDSTLPLVMSEMVRTSSRWILCGEYFAEQTEEVAYRGHEGALFRRDYGLLFAELFPDLTLRDRGFLGKDDGWDDVTWWLFERG